MKLGKGKGNKKDIGLFDTFTMVDNPPPAGRVELLASRYAKGLDIWTGKPIQSQSFVEMVYNDEYVSSISINAKVPEEPENWELEDLDEY